MLPSPLVSGQPQGTITGLELQTDRVRAQIAGDLPALVDLTLDAGAELHLIEGTSVWLSVKATDLDIYPDTNWQPRAVIDLPLSAVSGRPKLIFLGTHRYTPDSEAVDLR